MGTEFSDDAAEAGSDSAVFERHTTHAGWYWAGGIGLILVAAGGFVWSIYSDTGAFSRQAITTVPILMALGLISTALRNRRIPTRVAIDGTGLTLADAVHTWQIRWDQIAWEEETAQALTHRKQVVLYGRDGKVLVKLPEAYGNFHDLVLRLNRRVKANRSEVTGTVRLKRLKRRSWLLIGFSVFFISLGGVGAYTGLRDRDNARRLIAEGISGSATIERKFVAPNGVTKRVEYRVDAKRPDGSQAALQNVEVDPFIWEILEVGQKASVRYVPAAPDISEPAFGAKKESDTTPEASIGLSALMALFGLVFLSCGALNRFGIDIVQDSETKKWKIARSPH